MFILLPICIFSKIRQNIEIKGKDTAGNEDYTIINCIISGINNDTPIWFPSTLGEYWFNIIGTTFYNCKVPNEGGAFCVNGPIKINISSTCISDCSATKGAAFYYSAPQHTFSVDDHLIMNYVSAYKCASSVQSTIFIDNSVKQNHKFYYTNETYCSSKQFGVCTLYDMESQIYYNTYANNTADSSILYIDNSFDGSSGTITYTNFIGNVEKTTGVIYYKGKGISINNCFFTENKKNDRVVDIIFSKDNSPITSLSNIQSNKLLINTATTKTSPFVNTFNTNYFITEYCGAKPLQTPYETPYETPDETPMESPEETPYETPIESPLETPYDTPEDSPLESPYESPIETPIETPDSTTTEISDITTKDETTIITSSSTTTSTSTTTNEGSEGLNGGDQPQGSNAGIIGGAVAAVVVVLIVVAVVVFFVIRKKKNLSDAEAEKTSNSGNINEDGDLFGQTDKENIHVPVFTTTGPESDPFDDVFEELTTVMG